MSGMFGSGRGAPSIGGSKSNSQVIHIWAQGEGKTARGGNIRCAGDVLYSYQTPIARWYDGLPGKTRCVVITQETYSVTTSGQHMPSAADIPGGVEVHYFPGHINNLPNDWKSARVEILKGKMAQLAPMLEKLRRMRDVRDYDLEHPLTFAQSLFEFATANKLRSHIAKDARIVNASRVRNGFTWLESFDPALAARALQQHEETNTRDAASQVANAERHAKYLRQQALTQEERVADFRAGKQLYASLHDVPVMLRINNGEIETSRGARISIQDARSFFPALHRRSVTPGTPVGNFRFERVSQDSVVVGCHTIPLVEIYRIAAELGMVASEENPLSQ